MAGIAYMVWVRDGTLADRFHDAISEVLRTTLVRELPAVVADWRMRADETDPTDLGWQTSLLACDEDRDSDAVRFARASLSDDEGAAVTETETAHAGWHVYHGRGERHDGIAKLPPAPAWRQFDGDVLTDDAPDAAVVDPRPGAEARAKAYVPEDVVAQRANAAIYLRRPLLVTGRPGTGKSTLAHSIAWELRLGPVLYWPITSRAQLQDSLYRYDAVGRLQEANLRRLEHGGLPTNPIGNFITLGPLGTALVARRRPRVLLIDEFDKSDIDLPNDLLNVLEEGAVHDPGAGAGERRRPAAGASGDRRGLERAGAGWHRAVQRVSDHHHHQ